MIINFKLVNETVRDVKVNGSLTVFEAIFRIEEAGYKVAKDAKIRVIHSNSSYTEIKEMKDWDMVLRDGDLIEVVGVDKFTPNADRAEEVEKAMVNAMIETLKKAAEEAANVTAEKAHTCKCGGKCKKSATKATDDGTTIKFVDGAVEVTTKNDKGEPVFYRLTGNQIVARSVDGSVTVTAK